MGQREPKAPALAFTAVIFVVFAFGRFGTTFGLGPLYICDALIAMLSIVTFLRPTSSLRHPALDARLPAVPISFALFLLYVVFRLATSIGNGPILDIARDGAPYVYAVIGLCSGASFIASSDATKQRTYRLLMTALAIHAAWTALYVFTPLRDTHVAIPFNTSPLFQIRPDIDGALNTVFAGLCLRHFIREHERRRVALLGAVLGVLLNLGQNTRAGLISLLLVLMLSLLTSTVGLGANEARRGTKQLLAILAAIIVVTIGPLTPPGERIVATINPSAATTVGQLNATGTERARNLVWTGVVNWTTNSGERAIFGGGFGTNFLEQSHTLTFLEGTDYTGVRSPHSYWVGTFARLGVIGLGLLVASLLAALATIIRRRRDVFQDPLLSAVTFTLLAIIPVASLGVVLEGPFGALPFFWSLGIIFGLRDQIATTHDASLQRRVRAQRVALAQLRSK
jgi:hypothetical protein